MERERYLTPGGFLRRKEGGQKKKGRTNDPVGGNMTSVKHARTQTTKLRGLKRKNRGRPTNQLGTEGGIFTDDLRRADV